MKQLNMNESVNFVDDNNVFVGYDLSQCCCEDAGCYITEEPTPYSCDRNAPPDPDLSCYNFEPSYQEYLESEDLDYGTLVVFKLVAPGKPDLFLHFYNSHNGYYAHGLTIKRYGKEAKVDL